VAAAAVTTARRTSSSTCARSRTPSDTPASSAPSSRSRPHNPLPLLNQLAERASIGVEYLVEGPDEWRLRISRLAD
jgi:hypothetical protein